MNGLGHLGYVLLFLGQAALTQGFLIGWPIRAVGEGIWLGIGVRLGMSSIWIWGVVGLALECYGFYAWGTRR